MWVVALALLGSCFAALASSEDEGDSGRAAGVSDDLLAWAAQLGVQLPATPAFAIRELGASRGRGVVPLRDIARDELLLTVPLRLCMSPERRPDYAPEMGPTDTLALILLHEKVCCPQPG